MQRQFHLLLQIVQAPRHWMGVLTAGFMSVINFINENGDDTASLAPLFDFDDGCGNQMSKAGALGETGRFVKFELLPPGEIWLSFERK
jgi:hypothetical protein